MKFQLQIFEFILVYIYIYICFSINTCSFPDSSHSHVCNRVVRKCQSLHVSNTRYFPLFILFILSKKLGQFLGIGLYCVCQCLFVLSYSDLCISRHLFDAISLPSRRSPSASLLVPWVPLSPLACQSLVLRSDILSGLSPFK